jgi:hypothetical protein
MTTEPASRDQIVQLLLDGNPLSSVGEVESTVDSILAAGWRPPLLSGVPEEWGYRRASEPDSYTRGSTDEGVARQIAARASTGPWVVCKRTAPGPWTQVTS